MAAPAETLAHRFIQTAKRRWSDLAIADSTGRSLTFGRTLVASLMLARWLRRRAPDEQTIGLLLPSSVGGALANLATTFAGKVPVNLNFTAGPDAMAQAVARCGITTIISSRTFLAKAQLDPLPGCVYVEDILKELKRLESMLTLAAVYALPPNAICRRYLDPTVNGQSLATIIFSSGSTGVPKGVMLTHRNIVSNIDAVAEAFRITDTDVIVGILPFFHSFGFTATLWLPMLTGFSAVYHPNPTDAKTIGELAERYRATILVSTPTFCTTYLRKCTREQFANIRIAMVGAEKLREPIAVAFREKFGVDLLEGYGCTEMSPVVSANAPDAAHGGTDGANRRGSVGRPLPGVEARVVDIDTREGPLVGKEGLLLVRGPNLMGGYLGDPQQTRDVMADGWYVTGDIAMIDADGFVHITDRLSRFSKIAGEMVPHLKIERTIGDILGDSFAAAVTAVADPSRGERIVAFYTDPGYTPQALYDRLASTDLPRLWIPKREDLHFVETIPTLGTGKVDLRRVRELATSLTLAKSQLAG